MSRSALANLTAQYTDSENEDDHRDDDSSDSQNSQASQVIIPSKPATPVQTPEKQSASETKRSKRKKALRLVSYQDDTIVSDDEGNADDSSEESTDSGGENYADGAAGTSNNSNSNRDRVTPMDVDDSKTVAESGNNVGGNARSSNSAQSAKPEKSEKFAHYGFSLPPEPKGKPSQELVEKIRNLYDKMETSNMDMNRIIQERKEFRNPSIYEKLIQFCDINEFGTNYPPEMYDPLKWGAESFYEELARVQKNEMLKRQKERKDNDKIEQATALARKVEEEAKKRKSKWDQPAPVKAVVPPALTTTVTGTKGTVISAFGSLPKKPAA